MNRTEAMRVLLEGLQDDDIALFATGMISREAQEIRDRDANMYLIGSMGLVSAVGLGVALQTSRRVFVFDGDGSVLMDLGTLANIAASAPANLVHIVLDNGAYQSTGGQPTVSTDGRIARAAAELGYRNAVDLESAAAVTAWLADLGHTSGPWLAQIRVPDPVESEPPRIVPSPPELTDRFAAAIGA